MRHQLASVHELAQIGLLATLPGETLGRLAERMERLELAPGEPLVPADDLAEDPGHLYVVLTGVLGVRGGRSGSGVLRPGELFGEIGWPPEAPPATAVAAMTPATVARCRRATFDEFIRPLLDSD